MFGRKKRGLLPSSIMGLAAAVILTALLCLALTPIITRGILPPESASSAGCVSAGLAVFAAVYYVSKSRGRQAMPTAGIIAGGYLLLAALVCALGGSGFEFGAWLGRDAVAAGLGAFLAAVMSIGKKPVKRNRRRRTLDYNM